MNIYRTRFFANCPNNGLRIDYSLQIETEDVIPVEHIITAIEGVVTGYHEEIADKLAARFGGRQTLIAEHHGVTIETQRSAA